MAAKRQPPAGRAPNARALFSSCVAGVLAALAGAVLCSLLPGRQFEALRLARLRLHAVPASLRTAPPLSLAAWLRGDGDDRACLRDVEADRTWNRTDAAARRAAAARARCCLRSVRRSLPLALAARDRDVLRAAGFSHKFVAHLPATGMLDHFGGGLGSCAIVSSAPTLKLKEFPCDGGLFCDGNVRNLGKEIDAHDAVFRINRAPVKGFERWVGSKETVRILNLHKGVTTDSTAKDNYRSKDSVVFIRDEQYEREKSLNVSRAWNVKRLGNKGAVNEYVKVRRDYQDADIFMNHPIFSELALRFLHMSLVGGNPRSLSSGAQAVVLAMLLCDKVVSYEVASTDPISRNYRYYYNTAERDPSAYWHPFEEESGTSQLHRADHPHEFLLESVVPELVRVVEW